MPYSYYGYYDTPGYASYGAYRYTIPDMHSSPAFQWGYAAAQQYATKIPKRQRRAMSVQPVTATAGGVTVQYGSQSAEHPNVFATPRQRRAAIDKKLEELEFSDASEPIVAPVSLSSIRSRLLAACDLNDGAKRLYERHIKDVENVGEYTRKF